MGSEPFSTAAASRWSCATAATLAFCRDRGVQLEGGERSATLQGGWRRRGRFMVWRSRRVGAKVRVTASVKLLPVPSARIPCFINVHQHNKRCREVGFWVFAERRCWSRTMELECFCEFLLYVPGVAFLRRCAGELGPCRSEISI